MQKNIIQNIKVQKYFSIILRFRFDVQADCQREKYNLINRFNQSTEMYTYVCV